MEVSALNARPDTPFVSGFGSTLLKLRNDDQLVALFRDGNENAFTAIHDRYNARLLAYMSQILGSQHTAEDALQDVMVRAHKALLADRRPISLKAWLYRIARNRCIDEVRKPGAIPVEELGVYEAAPSSNDPINQSSNNERIGELVVDIERLPEQQRSALLLRELEGLSYEDLASTLNVTVPAVKSLLVRARDGLVNADEARTTTCTEIRTEIADSHERGVRITGKTRRHIKDCQSCHEYRDELKRVRVAVAGFAPATGFSILGSISKIFGIGASGGSAVAGGGAAISGSVATVTATKVCAVLCIAAAAGGAAEVVKTEVDNNSRQKAKSAAVSTSPASVAATDALHSPLAASDVLPEASKASSSEKADAPSATPTSEAASKDDESSKSSSSATDSSSSSSSSSSSDPSSESVVPTKGSSGSSSYDSGSSGSYSEPVTPSEPAPRATPVDPPASTPAPAEEPVAPTIR